MERLSSIFKALSDETRLRTLKLLENGELCVCDIVAALDMVQPRASFHLRILKDAGLIKGRKQGRWIHYSLEDSDIFCRFLTLSVLERISENSVAEDRRRLREFKKTKNRCGTGDGKCGASRLTSGKQRGVKPGR